MSKRRGSDPYDRITTSDPNVAPESFVIDEMEILTQYRLTRQVDDITFFFHSRKVILKILIRRANAILTMRTRIDTAVSVTVSGRLQCLYI